MNTKKLNGLLFELEEKIDSYNSKNESISLVSIGWHIEHCLLVLNGVVGSISKSNEENYKWKFNLARVLVFILKKIPRGKGKAPKTVIPKENFDITSLKNHITISKKALYQLEQLPSNKYFEHPLFGKLKLYKPFNF